MAITLNDLTVATSGFAVNAVSADLSGCEELVSAPGTGKSIYLRQVEISCVSAITVTIGAGETSGAVTTVLLGPFNFATGTGSPVTLFLVPEIKLPANTSLTIDASGAGDVQVFVQGYIK